MASPVTIYYGNIVYALFDTQWVSSVNTPYPGCRSGSNLSLVMGNTPTPVVILNPSSQVPVDSLGNPLPVCYGDQVMIRNQITGYPWMSNGPPCIYGQGNASAIIFTLEAAYADPAGMPLPAWILSQASTVTTQANAIYAAANTGGTMDTSKGVLELSPSSRTILEFFAAPQSPFPFPAPPNPPNPPCPPSPVVPLPTPLNPIPTPLNPLPTPLNPIPVPLCPPIPSPVPLVPVPNPLNPIPVPLVPNPPLPIPFNPNSLPLNPDSIPLNPASIPLNPASIPLNPASVPLVPMPPSPPSPTPLNPASVPLVPVVPPCPPPPPPPKPVPLVPVVPPKPRVRSPDKLWLGLAAGCVVAAGGVWYQKPYRYQVYAGSLALVGVGCLAMGFRSYL